jgi:hypothetical protein
MPIPSRHRHHRRRLPVNQLGDLRDREASVNGSAAKCVTKIVKPAVQRLDIVLRWVAGQDRARELASRFQDVFRDLIGFVGRPCKA